MALRGSAKGTDGSEHAPSLVRDVLSSLGYSKKAPTSGGAVRQKWESLAALVSMVDALHAERQEQIAAQAPAEQRLSPLSMREVVEALAHRIATQDAPVMDGVTLASFVLDADKDDGPLFGVRLKPQPPGRGVMIHHDTQQGLIQIAAANMPDAVEAKVS